MQKVHQAYEPTTLLGVDHVKSTSNYTESPHFLPIPSNLMYFMQD